MRICGAMMVAMLLSVSASPARAQPAGVALRWDACFGEGTGALNKSFACDTNEGAERLIGSFISATDIPDVTSNEVLLDLFTSSGYPWNWPTYSVPMPAWWEFKTAGTCRQSSVSMNVIADPTNSVCQDWSQGLAASGFAFSTQFRGTGTARIVMVSAIPAANAAQIMAGLEYYSLTVVIFHDKTVGTRSCGGCNVPMGIWFNSVKVVSVLRQDNRTLVGPVNGSDAHEVHWQSGPSTVPVRRTAWGAVKALYR
jgi:hypothetical protein